MPTPFGNHDLSTLPKKGIIRMNHKANINICYEVILFTVLHWCAAYSYKKVSSQHLLIISALSDFSQVWQVIEKY